VPPPYSSQRVICARVAITDRCQLSPSGTVTTLVTHIGLHDAGLLPAFTKVRHNAYCRLIGYYLYYSVTVGGLELPKTTATGIVGAYGGLGYLSTVLGGCRLLGMERTVFYGGVVVMCGHIALAIVPGLAGVAAGLILVALGSGALKANASSLLGTLYEKGDARSDGGFTLFYLGINLGPFIGPLITGLLQTHAGFHFGFGAAAVGMALGLAQYVRVPAKPGRARPHCAKPIATQRYWMGCRVGCGRRRRHRRGLCDRVGQAVQPVAGDHRRHHCGLGGVLRGDAGQCESDRNRANPSARLHSDVHRERGVLVAVPADIHGVGGLLRRADELVHRRLDRTVELDRLDRTRLDHRALTTIRDHVDEAGQSRAHHNAQVRLRRDRDGTGIPAVPADVGHDGQGGSGSLVVGIMAVFAVCELLLSPIGLSVTTKLAPEAFRAQMMALYFFRSASAPRCRECWPATTIRRTNSRTSGSSEPLRCSPAWSYSRSCRGSAG
jgi:hypothetical protein